MEKTDIDEAEAISLVHKLMQLYRKHKSIPGKLLKMARLASENHPGFPLFHRLYAKFVIENDPSALDFALSLANKAATMYPRSLEYRWFHSTLVIKKFRVDKDVLWHLAIINHYQEALLISDPEEPYFELYIAKEEQRDGSQSPVESIRSWIQEKIDSIYMEIEDLPTDFLHDIFCCDFSRQKSIRRMLDLTDKMVATYQSSCAFVHRMHSELCFLSAMGIKAEEDGEERRRLLNQAYCSARIAHFLFEMSVDYLINFCVRSLQCRDDLSVSDLRGLREKLTVGIDAIGVRRTEPYSRFLTKDEASQTTKDLVRYQSLCAQLVLLFIKALEEAATSGDSEKVSVISAYFVSVYGGDLKKAAQELVFSKRNITYLLKNIPKVKLDPYSSIPKGVAEIECSDEDFCEIMEMYRKKGPSEARQLTQRALAKYASSSVLHRLHAKYTIESKRSEMESALKHAKMAVHLNPRSLDHRFFYSSLLYKKAAASRDKMLYWEIAWACKEALAAESVGKEAVVEDVGTDLHNLIEMCYRAIDSLPTLMLDDISEQNTGDLGNKLAMTEAMLNASKGNRCAFIYRVCSDLFFKYHFQIDEVDMRRQNLIRAYVAAVAASETFGFSLEYRITAITRMLQAFDIKLSSLLSLKLTLRNLLNTASTASVYEPYYRHLVGPVANYNEVIHNLKSCILLLVTYITSIEFVANHGNRFHREEDQRTLFSRYFYALVNEIDLTEFMEKSIFFNLNIKYLLENPTKLIQDKSKDVEKEKEQKEALTRGKKKKKKKKKNKNKDKGMDNLDLEAPVVDRRRQRRQVLASPNIHERDLSQDMNAQDLASDFCTVDFWSNELIDFDFD